MAELYASTSLTSRQRGQGSPFAAELDRRLAGDEPLASIITCWCTKYFAWRESQPSPGEGGPSLLDLTDNETTALTLDIGWSFSSVGEDEERWLFSPVGEDEELTKAIKSPGVYPEVQIAWDDMRQARAALRAAAVAAGAQPSQQA
jgi:hypothetical protein